MFIASTPAGFDTMTDENVASVADQFDQMCFDNAQDGSSSSSPSLMNSPEHRPGRVDGSRRGNFQSPRKRRPSDDLLPDPLALNDLELHAQAIASNLDMCLRDLRGSVHGMSDLTLEFMQIYSSAIVNSCDQVDAAIKNQYKLIAKAEELNAKMLGAQKVVQEVNDMKRLVDILEASLLADNSS